MKATEIRTDTTIELEKIDCNCNNCICMYRDLKRYKYWENYWRTNSLKVFERRKAKAIEDAEAVKDEKTRGGMLRVANKMRFEFDKKGLLSYGLCSKFTKKVSFIPNICQLETQECFAHRRAVSARIT